MKYDIRPAKVFLQSSEELKGSWNVYLLRAKIRDLLDPATYKVIYTEVERDPMLSAVVYVLPGGQQVEDAYDQTRGWHFRQLKGSKKVAYDKAAAKAWFTRYARYRLPPVFRLGPYINNTEFYGSENMEYYYIHATAAELQQANRSRRTPRQFIFIGHDGQEIHSPQYFLTADGCNYQLIKKTMLGKRTSYRFAFWSPYKKEVLEDYLRQAT